jgi:ABC-2 type transport system permease protein
VGAVASGVGDVFESTPQLRELLPGGEREIVDAYLALTMGTLGLMAAVAGVQAAMRLRGEEAGGRAEPVLATAVGRFRWALGHVAVAAAGPAALLATGGLAAGLVHGARTGDVAGEAPRVLAAALVQLPAAWVLAALAVGLWGVAPRLAPASWAALVAALLLGQLGPLLELDPHLLDLSPFAHVPALPAPTWCSPPSPA